MWLGLLNIPSPDGDQVIICAWIDGRDRPFTIAGPRDAAPDMVRALRRTPTVAHAALVPSCDACGTPLDLPPL
jgi:hypothetical protein